MCSRVNIKDFTLKQQSSTFHIVNLFEDVSDVTHGCKEKVLICLSNYEKRIVGVLWELAGCSVMTHNSISEQRLISCSSLLIIFREPRPFNWLCLADAGSPAEQREDTGQQPNAGRAELGAAAPTGTQEGAAQQTLPMSAGELRVLPAAQVHPRYGCTRNMYQFTGWCPELPPQLNHPVSPTVVVNVIWLSRVQVSLSFTGLSHFL